MSEVKFEIDSWQSKLISEWIEYLNFHATAGGSVFKMIKYDATPICFLNIYRSFWIYQLFIVVHKHEVCDCSSSCCALHYTSPYFQLFKFPQFFMCFWPRNSCGSVDYTSVIIYTCSVVATTNK